jgi:hypothetical protein
MGPAGGLKRIARGVERGGGVIGINRRSFDRVDSR